MLILQWTLGLVVLIEALMFGLSHEAACSFARTGLRGWIRSVLAGGEVVAALLFMAPPTVALEAGMLIAVLLFAILLPLLHGMFAVGSLVVFAAAALAVGTHRRSEN